MRALFVGIVLSVTGACVPRHSGSVDPTLPEATTTVERISPHDVLRESASVDEPSVRGRALELLIVLAAEPGGSPFAQRALMDPDPWIQEVAVSAIASRIDEKPAQQHLIAFVAREDGLVNPYAQSRAALALMAAGYATNTAEFGARYESMAKRPWVAAPHAFVAAKHGDKEALAFLIDAVARADLPVEQGFLLDVAASRLPGLAKAFEQGQELVDDDLKLAYALCRLLLGDSGGEHLIRNALSSDDEAVRHEAIELLVMRSGTDHLLAKAAAQRRHSTRWDAELALVVRGKGSVESFLKAIEHPNRLVREAAVRHVAALKDTGHKKWMRVAKAVVQQGLDDEDSTIQIRALRAVNDLDLANFNDRINALIVEETRAVRVEAAGTYLLIGAQKP